MNQLALDFTQAFEEDAAITDEARITADSDWLFNANNTFPELGLGNVWQILNNLRDRWMIADEAIDEAIERHGNDFPQWKKAMLGAIEEKSYCKGPLWSSWCFLRQRDMEIPDTAFKAHCLELLDRVAEFEKVADYTAKDREKCLTAWLAPATDAELLVGFREASLMAPLNQIGFGCYQTLFERVYPEHAQEIGDIFEYAPREDWDGQLSQRINTLKEKYKQNRGRD